ncbi:M20/M25/M40 family metallo-hydrolase [Streptomyces sp. HU2014]|uniref:M20/M25/M40 family metallo-hydrolase n=1 Tax=Streptomyces sp. HU2014 TaxID=2939414 RepID=UPI00200D5C6F|nr:M20/M25/M40 family metallo-hydrolase [Streptomyces sp. HU2014]UQI45632.1 M20/M25/M40 family metallo-hydrolase [Streptomyces sp. HU2014]
MSTGTKNLTGFPTDPVGIAQRLIRFATVNPPGAEAACVHWVRDLLDAAGLDTRLLAKDPGRPNLIARLPGRGLVPPLLLHAHVDVVPVAGQEWTRDPFGGEVVDGELWGRGAVDMKGHLAMMLAALLRLAAAGTPPAGDVVLAVVADEEAGSATGARFLVEEHPELFAGVRHAIGEDGGAELGLGRQVRLHPVVVAEKRAVWVRATLHGTPGHASRAAGPTGAAHKLQRLLTAIDGGGLGTLMTPAVDRMLQELAAALPQPFGSRVAAFRADPDDPAALAGMDETDARYLRSLVQHTVNATVVHGGTATNVLPARIDVELDGRLLPGDFGREDFLRQLRERVGCDMDLEVLVEGDKMPAPRLDGFYERLAGILKAKDPEGISFPMVTTASTDARLFPRLGIQCYGWLPLLHDLDRSYRGRLHCPDERIAVGALEFGADCFHELLIGHD